MSDVNDTPKTDESDCTSTEILWKWVSPNELIRPTLPITAINAAAASASNDGHVYIIFGQARPPYPHQNSNEGSVVPVFSAIVTIKDFQAIIVAMQAAEKCIPSEIK